MNPIDSFILLAAHNGYLVALMLICLMQYLLHADRMERLRKKMAGDARKLLGLQNEVSSLQKDRAQIRFEHQIFEEFIAQPNFDEAMKLLLTRFIPRPAKGFGAWLEKRDDVFIWSHFRGLSSQELLSIPLSKDWFREFDHREFQILDESDVKHSFLYNYIPSADRRRLKQLFVFPVRHNHEITGLLITTSLYPAGMALERRLSLALRILNGLEGHFHHSQELRLQQNQLKTTREVLELRDISDRHGSSVRELVDEYLSCLIRQIGMDRAFVAFSREEHYREVRSIQRVGSKPNDQQREDWDTDEKHLIKIAAHRGRSMVLDPDELDIYGLSEPLRHVIIIPLSPREGSYGMMCLMRHQTKPLSEAERRHTEWAGEYLSEILRRTLDQATMEMLATCDSLTGLLNRRMFEEKLDAELVKAKARSTPCSLLMIDLDHFKSINDTFGHQMGDEVLRRVAEVLKKTLDEAESVPKVLVARYGGEEMAAILPRLGTQEAARVAESVRSSIESLELEFRGIACPVTSSIGVATYPDQASRAEEVIEHADKALYRAKAKRRNQVCLFSPGEDILLEN
ncbi:MAG: GGDEF domain-containing protein [Planctomycetaceae bacterium]|jgi:diguanylate cyclase (GGDEF)-like protein|nr:GGDEF domain-containing protein [Planctomycetaceae bacterium]